MIEPVDSTEVPFDPAGLLSALQQGQVKFVVIGALAAVLHGDAAVTSEADITVRATPDDLAKLVAALSEFEARLLVEMSEGHEATVNVPVTVETFTSLTSARFLTRCGVLHVALRPDGVPRYHEWVRGASVVEISDGVEVKLGALDDVIASKKAAGRPKDRHAIPRLEALRDAIRRKERASE